MGTGILSSTLALDGRQTLSRILFGVAAAGWISLGLLLAGRALQDRGGLAADARSPAALTSVAGTAVVGIRVTSLGHAWAGAVLLGMAFVLWCSLLVPILMHWATPTVGGSLMLTVSTESLAVLCATLAQNGHIRWLLDVALAPLLVGLVLYACVMARFDRGQLVAGRGDQWLTGGALAICALAAGQVAVAAKALHALGSLEAELRALGLITWTFAVAWLPLLLSTELLRPRLGYDLRRWSTVFPVGMYAACSHLIGTTAAAPAIADFARSLTWVAAAAWVIVTAATLRRGLQLVGDRRAALPTRRRAASGRRSSGGP
jgi:tellurite resistance protein TehA-like permease